MVSGADREHLPELAAVLEASLVEVAALRAEVARLRSELEALGFTPLGPAPAVPDELLGLELVHEYNTRSA